MSIDYGTHATKIAFIGKSGRAQPVTHDDGRTSIPTAIYFDSKGKYYVGAEALNMGVLDPQNLIQNAKRLMGSDKILYADNNGKEWHAHEIAQICMELAKAATEKETGLIHRYAVVSVPANYTDKQKEDTIKAAKQAGFEEVDLIHEPTAAMFAYCANTERTVPDGIRLVCDVGGGTTDVSQVTKSGNRFEVIATNGVSKLGGMDFTKVIVDEVITRFESKTGQKISHESHPEVYADLWRRAEESKFRLNRSESVKIPVVTDDHKELVAFSQDDMRHVCATLLEQIIACLKKTLDDAQISLDDVIELIPIGGGSQLFCVLEALEKFYGKPLAKGDALHCVSLGAALKGWESKGHVQVDEGTILPSRGLLLRDVTAHALGLRALNAQGKEVFTTVLAKSVPMPSKITKEFMLSEEGVTDAVVEILQGEKGQDVDTCLSLGSFELTGLEPRYGEPHRIMVEFNIDTNGLLTATAFDPIGGQSADLQLHYNKSGQPSLEGENE
tara:strand:- start:14445 stop:15944 length:1500 start_codon:yes stop_codon:yes gene_type:complete